MYVLCLYRHWTPKSLVIHYVYIHNMNIDVHVRLQITIHSIMPCFDAICSYTVEPLNERKNDLKLAVCRVV